MFIIFVLFLGIACLLGWRRIKYELHLKKCYRMPDKYPNDYLTKNRSSFLSLFDLNIDDMIA